MIRLVAGISSVVSWTLAQGTLARGAQSAVVVISTQCAKNAQARIVGSGREVHGPGAKHEDTGTSAIRSAGGAATDAYRVKECKVRGARPRLGSRELQTFPQIHPCEWT